MESVAKQVLLLKERLLKDMKGKHSLLAKAIKIQEAEIKELRKGDEHR